MAEQTTSKNFVSEDWLAAWGGILIAIVYVAGLSVPSPGYGWNSWGNFANNLTQFTNLKAVLGQFLLVLVITAVGAYLSGKSVRGIFKTFPFLFLIAQAALFLAGNSTMKGYGLEPVIFSLIIGLVIGQTINIPMEFRTSLSSEWYVKVGLVLLGASIIFSDVLKAGSLGLIQAVVVVFSVWYVSYWICKKLKIDDELTFMLSSAVSICGVSAAIATAGAIKGDPKKLSYVVSLVLLTAIPMMLCMPYIAHYFDFPDAVTGAWLGGTIDTTGAVVAAGSLAGETALKVSTIVKFSQNVLLGVAAFIISIYWTYKKNDKSAVEKPSLRLIWDRFPKFVIGFILTSIIFSFLIKPSVVVTIKDSLKSLQTLWFVLAFSAIGLETKLSDIFNHGSQKPLIAFLTAQFANILITLVIAWFLFRGA